MDENEPSEELDKTWNCCFLGRFDILKRSFHSVPDEAQPVTKEKSEEVCVLELQRPYLSFSSKLVCNIIQHN